MTMGWITFHGIGGKYPLGFSCSIFTEMVSRNAHLLLDKRHCVIIVLTGQLRGALDLKAVHNKALGVLQAAAADIRFTEREWTRW